MKKKINTIMLAALFYGSLWGIAEATLGHLLHFVPLLVSGFVMFPLAVFIMMKAYRHSGDTVVILFTGLTAAAIKLVDLFVPGLPLIKTLNPAFAIVLEASVVILFSSVLLRKDVLSLAAGTLLVSFSWRVLFVCSSLLINAYTPAVITLVQHSSKMIHFVLVEGAVSAVLAFFVLLVERKTASVSRVVIRPYYAFAALCIALCLQFFM